MLCILHLLPCAKHMESIWLTDSQRESAVPWICRSTWLTLLPDEVILQIIYHSTCPSDFFGWSICCKRISIICKDQNLITMMKRRFIRSRIKLLNGTARLDIVYELTNNQIIDVMSYSIYNSRNRDGPIYQLQSRYDFVNNVLYSYQAGFQHDFCRPYQSIVDQQIMLNEKVETIRHNGKSIILFGSIDAKSVCPIENGVPHGLYQNFNYGINIVFNYGEIQLYKDKHTTAKLNKNGKVNMICKRENLFIEIKNGILLVFNETIIGGKGRRKVTKTFCYNSRDEFNITTIDEAVEKLGAWGWRRANSISFLHVTKEGVDFVKCFQFKENHLNHLKDYDIYKKKK